MRPIFSWLPDVRFSLRKNGVLSMENEERLLPDDTAAFLKEIYELADNRDMRSLLSHGDDDFSFAIPGVSRFRVSAYKQRGTLSAVIRVITFRLPDYHMLGIPDAIINLGLGGKGMTLITGPAGSGKSTTLACIIDQINQNQEKTYYHSGRPSGISPPAQQEYRQSAGDSCGY